MDTRANIQFNVLDYDNKSNILDIDCQVDVETPIVDIIEIMFTHFRLVPENIKKMFIIRNNDINPIAFKAEDCAKRLCDFNFSNGTMLIFAYSRDH